jgi:hypothetical protein
VFPNFAVAAEMHVNGPPAGELIEQDLAVGGDVAELAAIDPRRVVAEATLRGADAEGLTGELLAMVRGEVMGLMAFGHDGSDGREVVVTKKCSASRRRDGCCAASFKTPSIQSPLGRRPVDPRRRESIA